MTRLPLLSEALAQVAQQLGLEESALAGRIERVDVHPRRGVIVELRAPAGPIGPAGPDATTRRWFRFDGGLLRELVAREDSALPLCSRLERDEQPVAWRPGRRVVLKRDHGRSFVKGYRRGRSAQARLAHESFQAAAHSVEGLAVPQLHYVDEELEALHLSRLSGKAIAITPEASGLFFQIGEALSGLQSQLSSAPLPSFEVAEELDVLDVWRSKVELACDELPQQWLELASAAKDAASTVEPGPMVGCHRDLHDGQLLDVAGSPGLLDFDLACLGDAMLDPANLLAHMELRHLQGLAGASRAGVDACSEALLDGLEILRGENWMRLRFYQATAFLRLALVYSLRPRWRNLPDRLVVYARRCLEDLVRIA